MKRPVTRRFVVIAAILLFAVNVWSQSADDPTPKKAKPYHVLTSGKQVTIKSSKNIKNIMVWTASGHRIVEQRDLNLTSYSFTATTKESVYFLMIQYEGLKPYTEKIGVQ